MSLKLIFVLAKVVYRRRINIVSYKHSETANLCKAADPARFVELSFSHHGKNSIEKFPDPDRDRDQRQCLYNQFLLFTHQTPPKCHQNSLTTFSVYLSRQTDKQIK